MFTVCLELHAEIMLMQHVHKLTPLFTLFTMQVVRWFFECVNEFSNEDRGKLLRFTTGSSSVPVEGFKVSVSFNFRNIAFRIYVSRWDASLFCRRCSHTTANSVGSL